MASHLRQRLVELIATHRAGVGHRQLGGWRAAGRAPHRLRLRLIRLAAEEGLQLREDDFEGWGTTRGRHAAGEDMIPAG
jgi:hypothetical protein